MIDLATALNAHEVNPDLRGSFWSEWKFNEDRNPETRVKFPLFQEIESAILGAIGPIAGTNYRLALVSRYLEWNGTRFDARQVTPLMAAIGKSSVPGMWRDQEPQPIVAFPACASCQGTGAGDAALTDKSGVPEPILAMHRLVADKFKAPQFAGIRGHRGGLIASGLQRMEGGQGPQAAEFHPISSGIFQILFTGEVFGFDPMLGNRGSLVHFPEAWNYPVKLSGLPANVWNYPENTVGRELFLADALGVNPNSPREHVDRPWRLPCAACGGLGRS